MLVVLFLSLISPLQYRSEAKLLIVQKHSFNIDAYAAARSSERVAQILSQVVYTDSFMRQVIRRIPEDSSSPLFGSNERKARKTWNKTITVKVAPNSNLLEIKVYDKNIKQAEEIISAISYILINRGVNYHGGENIIIKQVDSPLNSRYPVRPNIPLNLALAFILGLILSVGFFYYQETMKFETAKLQENLPPEAQPNIQIDDFSTKEPIQF